MKGLLQVLHFFFAVVAKLSVLLLCDFVTLVFNQRLLAILFFMGWCGFVWWFRSLAQLKQF
jgi:hypothetical protein